MGPETTTEESTGGVPVWQQLALVAGVLLLVFGTTLTPRLISGIINTQDNDQNTASVPYIDEPTEVEAANPNETSVIEPFSNIRLQAEAVYVWDMQNQRSLYKSNENTPLPLASITKLMTALLAHEILPVDAQVTISEKALSQEGDSGLLANEVFDRQTLSDYVLMTSSNDGAYALAEAAGSLLATDVDPAAAFVAAMNIRAEEIGLVNTSFSNPSGLDTNEELAGAYGTAKDISFLMEYIINNAPEVLSYTTRDIAEIESESGFTHQSGNTNYYIDEIPGLIGSKTGFTNLAGGNLVVAYNAGLNRPVVISVLGSTKIRRFADVLALIEEANIYVAQN